MLHYDADKMVPIYGFGAKPRFPELYKESASHCFPCTGNPNSDEVPQLDGVFQAYNYAIQNIILDGPTFFAPILRTVVKNTLNALSVNEDHYCFFLLITDGIIHDLQATIDALVEASHLPISIVIVGVGDEGKDY